MTNPDCLSYKKYWVFSFEYSFGTKSVAKHVSSTSLFLSYDLLTCFLRHVFKKLCNFLMKPLP